jgi:hypothetical protein
LHHVPCSLPRAKKEAERHRADLASRQKQTQLSLAAAIAKAKEEEQRLEGVRATLIKVHPWGNDDGQDDG